jgi:Zn-dependent protease
MLTDFFTNPITFLLSIACLVITITIHECAHAVAADKLGDPTPRLQGRITLNPMAHLDLVGTLMLVLANFGWGKPVQFDPYNLQNPRKDAMIISLAGPLSNFILASLLSILLKLFIFFNILNIHTIGINLFLMFMVELIYYNILLGIFNLIPIHPLDGFKIVGGLLPERRAREWYELERYGFIFLLLLIIPIGSAPMVTYIIAPIRDFISGILLGGI